MKKLTYAALLSLMLSPVVNPLFAGDEKLCLDCHEPAQDWEGMSVEEVLAVAADTSIKRHADNAQFSQEQLKVMIAKLLKRPCAR